MRLRIAAAVLPLLAFPGVAYADACQERPSLAPPIAGGGFKVVFPFGPRLNPLSGRVGFHAGVDLTASSPATVAAMLDGRVVGLHPDPAGGVTIVLRHCGGWTSEYRHVVAPLVAPGTAVRRGESLANVRKPNEAGRRTRIHVSLRLNGSPVDPAPLFADGEHRAR